MSSISPRLTIITVVRNNLNGLIATSNSVLSQNFASWEMIIKDGNSSDGTREYANQLTKQDARIKLVTCPDVSIYDAMNLALETAEGEYTLMLNGGDVLAGDTTLRDAFTLIDAEATPIDLAFFGTLCRFESGRSVTRPARALNYIKYGLPAIHQSTLFLTSFHKRFPYDLRYPICADYVTISSQMRAGAKAKRFDLIFSEFEIRRDSTSYAGRARSRREMDQALAEIWCESWSVRKMKAMRRYVLNLVMEALVATGGFGGRR